MANFIKQLIARQCFQMKCLWAPLSFKNDFYLIESQLYSSFVRQPFNIENMLTWVCIK